MDLLPEACEGVAALAITAAAVAVEGCGWDCLGPDEEKCDSMQDVTWASRAASEPSAPFGGSASWQIGHSSSSRNCGLCGGEGG